MTDVATAAVENAVTDAFTRALTNFKGNYHFERTISRGEFSNSDKTTSGMHVQFDYAPDATAEDFLAVASEAALWAKAVVFQELKLEAHLDAGGVLHEVVNDAFPGSTTEVIAPDPRDKDREPIVTVSGNPPYTQDQVKDAGPDMKKAMRKENAVWAEARYASHPSEFYDNRAKKASGDFGDGYPDFTHKQSRAGFYDN
jgi:hypothetical protein